MIQIVPELCPDRQPRTLHNSSADPTASSREVSCRLGPPPCLTLCNRMKITGQNVADKIADHLQGKVSQAELVDWAERAMMDGELGKRRTPNFWRTSSAASGWQTSPSSDCAGKIATTSSGASATERPSPSHRAEDVFCFGAVLARIHALTLLNAFRPDPQSHSRREGKLLAAGSPASRVQDGAEVERTKVPFFQRDIAVMARPKMAV